MLRLFSHNKNLHSYDFMKKAMYLCCQRSVHIQRTKKWMENRNAKMKLALNNGRMDDLYNTALEFHESGILCKQVFYVQLLIHNAKHNNRNKNKMNNHMAVTR